MDLLFPLLSRTAKVTPSFISNTAVGRSIFSNVARTLQRSGSHFGFDIMVAKVNNRDVLKAALRNLRVGMDGQANRLWFADPSYRQRGSFPTGELVVNGAFAAGAAGWTTSNATLSVADGYARVQNTTTSAGVIDNTSAIALVSGVAYVVRVLTYPGSVAGWAVSGGTTSFSSSYFGSGGLSAQGLFIQALTASAANFFLSLSVNSTVSGDFAHFLWASLSRCALVNGGSQTGSKLNIQGLPASTAGLLLPGDRVQIGTQLNAVAAPLNSDGSGFGVLQCQLPWRASPANGAAVIISNPMARCILSDNTGSWDESPGGIADFEFQMEESLDS